MDTNNVTYQIESREAFMLKQLQERLPAKRHIMYQGVVPLDNPFAWQLDGVFEDYSLWYEVTRGWYALFHEDRLIALASEVAVHGDTTFIRGDRGLLLIVKEAS